MTALRAIHRTACFYAARAFLIANENWLSSQTKLPPFAKRPSFTISTSVQNIKSSSYRQIARASLLTGSSNILKLLASSAQAKALALTLGPNGIGIFGVLTNIQTLAQTISGVGLQSANARAISIASETGNYNLLSDTLKQNFFTSLVTSFAGLLITFTFSPLISYWAFSTTDYWTAIAYVALAVFFAHLASAPQASLQGLRQLGSLAIATSISGIISCAMSIPLYWSLGVNGIAIAMTATSIIHLIIFSLFSRTIPNRRTAHTNIPTLIKRTLPLIGIGLALMWSSLLVHGLQAIIRASITSNLGLASTGIYIAAFSMSGMFVNFVLGAMSTDYYPRLCASSSDYDAANNLVNEQTEVAITLMFPGLIALITLAEPIIIAFFSSEFRLAPELMQWFSLGCLGRGVSWPLGFLIMAMGKGKLFALTETTAAATHLASFYVAVHYFGLVGSAIAFSFNYLLYTIFVYAAGNSLTKFHWSHENIKLFAIIGLTVIVAFVSFRYFASQLPTGTAITSVVLATIFSVRQLYRKLT
jgi:antigen flippase